MRNYISYAFNSSGAAMKTLARKPLVQPVLTDAYWVGTNLCYLRKKKGLSQVAVAQAAGISARRLRDVENASWDVNVTLTTLSALAKALGVDTQVLFKQHQRGDGIRV
jgi:DNA-binding XRE family transcriptional regulator